ncbi:TetR family transcriptional regulator [Streptomyces sp. KM273126]|uniref:TetR family transcriptional regulator n=1 Tax=Streptomyces sp. KM273126 TaxID=2545247 RepID=UPI00103DAB80|nr:TetR family transcriptional regulator [Streptomyces sp. KM273126]MBA2807873.1 TetR family transcriptional regulator [Streptomyces sp. KM273126]
MSGTTSSVWQPGTGTVYRAALGALAERGPRRVGVTHIARQARCNRSQLYRNWRSTQALIRDATLAELKHVLDVARLSLHLCLGLPATCPDCRSEDVR